MKWNNKYIYPKYSRSNEDGLRKYLFGDQKLPSVTAILSATKSEEDKASLELWKKRVGYKEANRIKTEASSRGSSMHSYIEDYLRGRVNESFFDSNEQYYLKEYNLKVGEQPYIKLGAFLLWNQIYPNFSVEDIFYAYQKLNKTLI